MSASRIRSTQRRLKRREAIVEEIKRGFKGVGRRGGDRRCAELAKIHVLAKQAGLDRETYEAVLLRLANVMSAADLDALARNVVIDYLQHCVRQSPRDGTAHRADAPHNLASKPLLGKIEALLADGGKPWAYVEAMARRICKRERLAFCSDAELRKIVAALSYDQQRREHREATSAHA